MEQNLSQYYIFYTAAQCGSISRASRELYISQPAVSKAIQKLEQSLNTVLFRREARGVSLTEEGRLLYRHVREAFHSLDEAEQTLARRKKLGISHLRLGAKRHSQQIRASALSAALYPGVSPCENYHRLSVHLPDPGTAPGKKDRSGPGWPPRFHERLRGFFPCSPSRIPLCPQTPYSVKSVAQGKGQ